MATKQSKSEDLLDDVLEEKKVKKDPTSASMKLRRSIADMLSNGEDQGFVRYAHYRHGYDLDTVDSEIKNFQKLKGGSLTGEAQGSGFKSEYSTQVREAINSFRAESERNGALGAVAALKYSRDLERMLQGGGGKVSTGPISGKVQQLQARYQNKASDEFMNFNAASTAFTANFIKALSGTQVSDKEREFLMNALPSPDKQEKENIIGMKQLTAFLKDTYEFKLGVKLDPDRLYGIETEGQQTGMEQPQTNPQDDQAYQWAQSNPDDPRSQQILDKLKANKYSKLQEQPAGDLTGTLNQSLTPEDDLEEPEMPQMGFFDKMADKVGEFTGIKKFGQGIGTTLFLQTKEGQDLQKKAQEGDKNAIETLNQLLEEAPNAKELIGSAGMTAATIASGGLAKGGSFLGKAAQGAATGYAMDVASGLEQNQDTAEALTPGLGTAIGGGLPVAGAVSRGLQGTVKRIASVLSGVPEEAITRAVQNPQNVGQAISRIAKNDEEKILIVNRAKQGLKTMMDTRSRDYAEALKNIPENASLSLDGLKKTVNNTLENFKLLDDKGKIDFTRSTFPRSQQTDLKEILSRISKWQDKSPTGLNDLKKVIDGYYRGTAESKGFDKIVTTLKNNLTGYLEKNVPEVAEMNKSYGKDSEVINQIVQELSLGEGKSVTTALNKLTSIFNRNSEFKKKLVEQLGEEGGQQVLDDIVGSMFTEWLPRGLSSRIISGIGGSAGVGAAAAGSGGTAVPALAAGLVASSPRIVGKASTIIGKAKQAGGMLTKDITGKDVVNALKKSKPGLGIEDIVQKNKDEIADTIKKIGYQYTADDFVTEFWTANPKLGKMFGEEGLKKLFKNASNILMDNVTLKKR